MFGKLSSIFTVIILAALISVQVGCKENKPRLTPLPVSTRDCYSTLNGPDESKLYFETVNGFKFSIQKSYVSVSGFDSNCKVKNGAMKVKLVDGEIAPWEYLNNTYKKESRHDVNKVPSAELLLDFEAPKNDGVINAAKMLVNYRGRVKCKPRLSIPELGVEYFNRNYCADSNKDILPQFILSDVHNGTYVVMMDCGLPDELKSSGLNSLNQLTSFKYHGVYGCVGNGVVVSKELDKYLVGVNFMSINNRDDPHVVISTELVRQSANFLINSYKKSNVYQ